MNEVYFVRFQWGRWELIQGRPHAGAMVMVVCGADTFEELIRMVSNRFPHPIFFPLFHHLQEGT